jgi:hypothetical protein
VKFDLSDLRERFDWAEANQEKALEMARASALLVRSITIESEALRFVDTLTNLARAYGGGKLEDSPYWKNLVPVTFNSIPATQRNRANATTPRLECRNFLPAKGNKNWCHYHCPPLVGSELVL